MPRRHFTALFALLGALLAAGRVRGDGEAPKPPRPRLSFDHMEHDFGIAAQEKELAAEFTAKNEGDAPLKVSKIQPDCGCYDAALSSMTIKPGESATLKVRFRTLVFSGPLTKKIRVFSDDPDRPQTTLRLKLDIVAGVIVDPGRIYFGDVLAGTLPSAHVDVKWFEGIGTPFHLAGIDVMDSAGKHLLDEEMESKTEPFAEEKWKGFHVSFSFKKAPPLGIFSATALIRTDHRDYSRIDVSMTANVSGKVYVQARDLYMGWVRQGQSKTRPLRVGPFKDGIRLGKVTVAAKSGRVTVEALPDSSGREGWWIVNITVPADAALGMLEDVVEIRSEVPEEPATEVAIRAEVVKLGGG